MEWLWLIVGMLVGGIIVGIYFIRRREKPVGELWVDRSNSREDPGLYLLPDVHPNIIAKKKYIILKVNVISHK